MKHLLKLTIPLFLFLLMSFSGLSQKSDLKILYVGGSANWDKRINLMDSLAFQKDIQNRKASFEQMLGNYFNSVTVIDAKDYKQELSSKYDVTVMDGTPVPIHPRIVERDKDGNTTKYKAAVYLTEDFDRPMLTIGELGETLGRGIGLKTDWYCLCLDADAHSFKKEHPIFNKPFSVKMTIENKPTPKDAYHYHYFYDGTMPETLPMWKVQTKGYESDQGFRVGMVSRPWGFTDSPDAEYISSGVCAKTLDAVAIGRHGNFLHWGFAASPEYMTDEAQTVLANAIVYISQFKGKGVIVRKYNDRIATREYLKELKWMATRESYQEREKSNEEHNQLFAERKKTALAKQEKGEPLNDIDKGALDFKPITTMPLDDYFKRYQKEFYPLFGTNTDAYIKFYDDNRNYFYGEGFYHIEVDEDVKSLKIPNNDKRILDEAIKMLESGKDVEKGKRILSRYTLCNFATPKEWRSWYNKNKDKLFFTEAGGWVFLVNSYEPGINNYKVREEKEDIADKTAAIQVKETNDMNPVAVATGVINNDNGSKNIIVKMRIHPGYHIYADVAKVDPFIASDIKIDLPKGYKLVDSKKPSFKSYGQSGTTIYEDEIVFSYEINGKGGGEAKCTVVYQCCDSHICFPPEEKTYTVKM